jgi:hypothetical protein
MWTAVRLLTVCVLGVSGLFALRSGLPSHPPRPPPAIHTGADDVAHVSLINEMDDPPSADEIEKKIVTIERFHVDVVDVAALQANAKAAPEPSPSGGDRLVGLSRLRCNSPYGCP